MNLLITMAQSVGEPNTRLAMTSYTTTKNRGQMAKPIMIAGFSESASIILKNDESIISSIKKLIRGKIRNEAAEPSQGGKDTYLLPGRKFASTEKNHRGGSIGHSPNDPGPLWEAKLNSGLVNRIAASFGRI
jgi:hypothetical protein